MCSNERVYKQKIYMSSFLYIIFICVILVHCILGRYSGKMSEVPLNNLLLRII